MEQTEERLVKGGGAEEAAQRGLVAKEFQRVRRASFGHARVRAKWGEAVRRKLVASAAADRVEEQRDLAESRVDLVPLHAPVGQSTEAEARDGRQVPVVADAEELECGRGAVQREERAQRGRVLVCQRALRPRELGGERLEVLVRGPETLLGERECTRLGLQRT